MAATPHDVFISYSSKDKVVADAICAILERRGLRCWIAPRDVTPSDPWARSIIQAINGARVFVLVFTDSSNHSPQVAREVERAAQRELPIIPFRVENIAPTETLEFFLSSPHWMDAISPPIEQHIERLADVLKGLLDRQPSSVPPEPPRLEPVSKPSTASAGKAWVPLAMGGAVAVAVLITWLLTRNHPPVAAPGPSTPPPVATAPAPAAHAVAAAAPSTPAPAQPAAATPAAQSTRPSPPAVTARAAPPRVDEATGRLAPQAASAAPASTGSNVSIGTFAPTGQTGGTNSFGNVTNTTNNYGAAP